MKRVHKKRGEAARILGKQTPLSKENYWRNSGGTLQQKEREEIKDIEKTGEIEELEEIEVIKEIEDVTNMSPRCAQYVPKMSLK